MNVSISPSELKNKTRISIVDQNDAKCIHQGLPANETRFALLANLFLTEGKPGKVIKVHAKKRIGKNDFIASIRKALEARYTEQLVGGFNISHSHLVFGLYLMIKFRIPWSGLGGTFLLKEGKAKQHVMPDFSTTPLTSDDSLNEWLKFYDMSAPLVAVGTLVSSETPVSYYDFNKSYSLSRCISSSV